MEEYLNPENIYTIPTENGKVIKVVLEGPFLDAGLAGNIDEICEMIRINDLETLKHFVPRRIKEMTNDENLIKALNLLIEQAVCDGGDAGGAYHQNEQDLVKSINGILNTLELQDKYEVVKYEDTSHWSNYYIKKK